MAITQPEDDQTWSSSEGAPPLSYVIPPRPPPDVPNGWTLSAPDFVGVGTMKSGTTWWWSILTSHPDVISPRGSLSPDSRHSSRQELEEQLYKPKEVHFFNHYGRVVDIDPASYHRHFPRPPGKIAGEWSPRYMYDFWTPPMLRMAAPDTKILVLLRDPLERLISGLSHIMFWGSDLDASAMDHQFRRGLYWQQLQTLVSYFDRDQILILQYEKCVNDVTNEARRTFEFLGVDPDKCQPSPGWTRQIGPKHPKPALNGATRDALRHAYKADLQRLLSDFPSLDGSLWPSAHE